MAASFPNLYSYSSQTGMVIPTADEIKVNVQNALSEIFGSDMDFTEDTPNGRLVESLTLMFKNVVGVNAQNINQLNLSYASGQYLDAIAAFYNLFRLPAVGSKVEVNVYSETPEYVFPTGTVVYDYFGNAYTIMNNNDGSVPSITYNGIRTGTVPMSGGTFAGKYYAQGWVESVETGPIIPVIIRDTYTTDPGTVNQQLVLSSENGTLAEGTIILANNVTGSILGRNEETDFELRKRIQDIRDFGGSSTMAIANRIWRESPYLRTVRVLENNTSSNKTVAGKTLIPNSVMVVVSGDIPEDSTGTQKRMDIATSIFKSKAAGIAYTDTASTDINTTSEYSIITNQTSQWNNVRRNIIPVTDQSSGLTSNVVFYEGRGIRIGLDISLKINGYSGVDIESEIRNTILQYVGGKITTLTSTELMMILSSSISGIFITSLVMKTIDPSDNVITEITPTAFDVITPFWIHISVD